MRITIINRKKMEYKRLLYVICSRSSIPMFFRLFHQRLVEQSASSVCVLMNLPTFTLVLKFLIFVALLDLKLGVCNQVSNNKFVFFNSPILFKKVILKMATYIIQSHNKLNVTYNFLTNQLSFGLHIRYVTNLTILQSYNNSFL